MNNLYLDACNSPYDPSTIYRLEETNVEIEGSICNSSGYNGFTFNTSFISNIEIYLMYDHTKGDLDLALMNDEYETIAESKGVTGNEAIEVTQPKGTYYIIIYPFSSVNEIEGV